MEHNSNANEIDQLQMSQMPRGRGRRSLPPPFLMKVYEMVHEPESNSIISWSPNNTSFIISDHIKFTTDILPNYFKHGNFSSFVYQLNNYGFKKVSWERFEYENPWFQAGKKHWLKNIKRRNQQFEGESSEHQASLTPSDVSEKLGMDADLETLRAEQSYLRTELQKLIEQQEEMADEFNTFQGSIKDKHAEMIGQVQKFIQNLREKKEMDTSRNMNNSEVAVNEGDNADQQNAIGKEQVQEEMTEMQPEGQIFSSPDDSGSPHQDQKASSTSGNAENSAFWKKMMEDDSEHKNGGDELTENHPKFIMNLEDLMASCIQVEGENSVAKPVNSNMEEEDHLKLWT